MTVTSYIESMLKSYMVTNTINFNARGDHPALSREDLEQEIAIVLAHIFEKYSNTRPEAALRRIGNYAVRNRVRDLYFRENAMIRGGLGNRLLRGKDRSISTHSRQAAVMVEIKDQDIVAEAQQLERLLIREAVENVVDAMTEVERRATRALFSSDEFSPHRPRRSTFLAAVQSKLRTV